MHALAAGFGCAGVLSCYEFTYASAHARAKTHPNSCDKGADVLTVVAVVKLDQRFVLMLLRQSMQTHLNHVDCWAAENDV